MSEQLDLCTIDKNMLETISLSVRWTELHFYNKEVAIATIAGSFSTPIYGHS